MKRTIRFKARARREIADARQWWLTNRDKAPAAFDEDLDAILELIAFSPGIGLQVHVRNGVARRVEVKRSGTRFQVRDQFRNAFDRRFGINKSSVAVDGHREMG